MTLILQRCSTWRCGGGFRACHGGASLACTKLALAEFEIQEAGIEKGEVEFEYRGADHWGLPQVEEKEEVPLRQSHDFELQMGITDRWLFSTTLGTRPAGVNSQVSSVELETQYEIIKREGNGIGLAFRPAMAGPRGPTRKRIRVRAHRRAGSGQVPADHEPSLQPAGRRLRRTDGLGFEYGWRAEYDFAKHWGFGVEMFGEIEDLSNPGSFNDQNHSLGPTLFCNPGGDDEDEEAGDVGEAMTITERQRSGAPNMEFSLNVGVPVRTDRRHLRHGAEIPRLSSRSRAWCASAYLSGKAGGPASRRPLLA